MKKKLVFSIIFIIQTYSLIFAHGFGIRQINGNSAGVVVLYDGGSPARFCQISIFSPADYDTPFQKGETDKNGNFFFLPDQQGNWVITADDDMGHVISTYIEIKGDLQAEIAGRGGLTQWHKILIALCLVFGFFGLFQLITGIKKRVPGGR